MLPARHRLRERADFASVLRGPGGARAGSSLLVVHAHRTDSRQGQPPRVGFVVSKAVGGAVVRNRTKRRLREILRADLASLPPGVDLVVRANPAAAEAPFTELQQTLKSLSHRVIRRLEASA